MSYCHRLARWLMIRLLPNMQRVTVAQCIRESDADGYVRIMRRLVPNGEFIVVFDPSHD